ncbi:MAG: hypothetical protein IJL78_06945 [Lachnospiraceae bacterium]|nr:hypothetical protein [Lachnospiraceae bacterium]
MLKKYRMLILLLAALFLFSSCKVTVNTRTEADKAEREATEEKTSGEEQDTHTDTEEALDKTSDEPDGSEENVPEEAGSGASGEGEPAGEESTETADPMDSEIPEFDTTPLPGYEGIVFVGDSRTLTMGVGGTYEFNLVPDDSIEATWGGELTDNSAFENARLAARKHRGKAVFWYGINDVQMNPQRNDVSVFINNYLKVLDAYLKIEPESTIYIVSILNTTVRERDYYEGQEENIRRYNAALYSLCLERGWYYIDVTPLLTGDDCFYEGDNIHFSKEWYETRYLPYVTVFTGLSVYQPD